MKKLIIVLSLMLSTSSWASVLEGQYICKHGFLGFSVADTLSIQTAKSGNLYISMNEVDFKLSPKCELLTQTDFSVKCDSTMDHIAFTKIEKGFKGKTLTTTLSFEKLGEMVIGRLTEKETGHGEALTVLVCRPVKN